MEKPLLFEALGLRIKQGNKERAYVGLENGGEDEKDWEASQKVFDKGRKSIFRNPLRMCFLVFVSLCIVL